MRDKEAMGLEPGCAQCRSGIEGQENPTPCLTRRTGTITLTESYLLADPAERNCRRTLMDSTDFLGLTNG